MIKFFLKIKTFPYLPTLKLKNKSETDIFFFLAILACLTNSRVDHIEDFILTEIDRICY